MSARVVLLACVLLAFTAAIARSSPNEAGARSSTRGTSAPLSTLDASRVRVAEMELAGPLRSLELVQAGRALVHGELAFGETVRVRVPVPVSAIDPDVAPRATWDVDASDERGRARFAFWVAEDPSLERVPIALRSRSRPPVEAARPEASVASVAALVATFLVVLALRRRPLAALAVAVVGATAGALAVHVSDPGGAGARAIVLEGVAGEDAWLEVRSGAGVLELARATGDVVEERVEVEPATVELQVDGELRGATPWRLTARGARIHALSLRPALGLARGGSNDAADLAEAWERVDGAWRAIGAWRKGAIEPGASALGSSSASDPGASAPPGWLAAGLPQGVDVLLGRFDERARPGEERWLRVTGW